MSVMYGAAGARGEAPAGFPHVRRALKELAAPRRVGVTEVQARLGALLTVTSTLRDSERPHVTEPLGLPTSTSAHAPSRSPPARLDGAAQNRCSQERVVGRRITSRRPRAAQ
ncbi:hypothetical protein AB0L74_30070 [Streptomyces sp. NPDC052020]|uniref:triphosphoribosyl-dephospho-CoA synthase n=1 Tax=Streptomyces sp. NPDC052020 TaxID=3155677 RepID=UPI00342B92A8